MEAFRNGRELSRVRKGRRQLHGAAATPIARSRTPRYSFTRSIEAIVRFRPYSDPLQLGVVTSRLPVSGRVYATDVTNTGAGANTGAGVSCRDSAESRYAMPAPVFDEVL